MAKLRYKDSEGNWLSMAPSQGEFNSLKTQVDESARYQEEFIATANQATFTLSHSYSPLQHRIDITVGGVPQYSPKNFTETSPTTFTLAQGIPAGTVVIATYFGASKPLSTDLETVVNNHTSNINSVNNLIASQTTKLESVTSQLAETAKGRINIRTLGVKGDGTDETLKIQSAIDFIGTSGGGILYFPEGVYYLSNPVFIKHNNVFLQGQNKVTTVFRLENNAKIRFLQNVDEVIIPTNSNSKTYNNLPPYPSLNYFDAKEYGGVDYRNINVGISDFTLSKISGSTFCLNFYKCDVGYARNIEVVFENPALSIGSSRDNAITTYYSSYIDFENVKINDNFDMTFGMFVYWSFGCSLKNIEIGNVAQKCLELKHVIACKLERISAVITTFVAGIRGISVNYGSNNVDISGVYLKNCALALSSSVEFQYSEDIHVKNVTFENTGVDIQNLKNSTLNGLRFNVYNNNVQINPIVVTAQPYCNFSASELEDATYTKNTAYYTYDGNYDSKELLTYGGETHYRYYTQLHQPTLDNVKINDVTITLNKIVGGSSACTFYSFFLQGVGGTLADLINAEGKFKVRNSYLPLSWKNVHVSDFSVKFMGDGNPAKTVWNRFINESRLGIQDSTFTNLNFDVIGASGTGNTPDIADISFINVGKLENVKFEKVKSLPYAAYGQSNTVVRAYKNVIVKDFSVGITNLGGTYNPTFLNLIEIRTGDSRTDSYILNEEYKNIIFDGCSVKGFTDFLYFHRGRVTITDSQLNGSRFVNNNIANTSFSNTTWIFMKDISTASVNQPSLKHLNTVNNVLIE